MRILGIDPGIKNMAVVLTVNGHVHYARFLRTTIPSMSRASQPRREKFMEVARLMLIKLVPDVIVIEQFAVRASFGTHLTEVVNIMIGALLMLAHLQGKRSNTVMASTWKGAAKRAFDLDKLYEHAKQKRLEPHIVDAVCLCVYEENGNTFHQGDRSKIQRHLSECKKWLLKNSPDHVKRVKRRKSAPSRKPR